jgi:hypothetical protein
VLLSSIAVAVALLANAPHMLGQRVSNSQESSFKQLRHSATNMSQTGFTLTQSSMVGVGIVLVFFRLRRKHQAAFGSTRLMHDVPWLNLQPSQSMDSVIAVRPAGFDLNYKSLEPGPSLNPDVDALSSRVIEAAFIV